VKFSCKQNTVRNCCRNIGHFLFCVRPLALHRQQTEKDKQNVDFPLPWKNFCGRPWLLVKTVTASFDTIVGQMTEMSQRKKGPSTTRQYLVSVAQDVEKAVASPISCKLRSVDKSLIHTSSLRRWLSSRKVPPVPQWPPASGKCPRPPGPTSSSFPTRVWP